MQPLARFYTTAATRHAEHRTRLLEEIAYLEERLHHIGIVGDCAYEKSLARCYGDLIRERRRQLAAMTENATGHN